jgi:S-adenosyl-L-methionine hydrolase (adenosine-forming)
MPGIITITTDFGEVYPAIMKGVIACLAPDARAIDITNSLPAGDVRRGAFVLRYASVCFPAGTTHLAVIDPGVGSDRRALVIRGERYDFIGPDNGLLLPAARAQGEFKVCEITRLDFFTKKVSPVFHGRDVFAPAAAYVASGKPIPGLREIGDPVTLDFGTPKISEGSITGRVIFVDDFGNVVTNIGGAALQGLCYLGEPLDINGWPATFVSAYYEGKEGELMVLAGSHDMAEITYKGGSAAAMAGLGADAEVVITPRGM